MYKEKRKKNCIILLILLVAIFTCMTIANNIQTDGGKVEVSVETFELDGESITYKLYKPEGVNETNKAPAVLLLHGYQNDKETNGAYAIELSRRGVVVMSIDEYGHGATLIGMKNRGYVNHKVTVNYGNDSEEDGTFVEISGTNRYKVMMNFSNLSFFKEHYSTDEDGNSIEDSSMGGIAAYALLSSFDYVDNTKIGVSGHSMGTWASWTTAAAYAGARNEEGNDITPKAVVLQCGELFRKSAYDSDSIYFNNVLLLTAKYDEFNYFRDYENTVGEAQLNSDLRKEFLGIEETASWDTTYGDFSDGSARRMELIITNHRLTTHDSHALTAAIDWFTNALGINTTLSSSNHVYMMKEWLVFVAMLSAIAAMIPLMELLLTTPLFASVACGFADKPCRLLNNKKWWKGAIITMLISCFTYPFLTQLGHALLPLPENVFKMTIGNGFLSWYTFLILVMLVLTILSYIRSKKKEHPMDFNDLGFASVDHPKKFEWKLFGKSLLLAVIMVAFMYVITITCQALFQLDLRFIWPFFKGFTGERFVQFLIYLPVFAIFFLLNNSKIFAGMRTSATTEKGFKGFMKCWWRNALCMVGGILILILIEYIPFFANIGPGADLLFSPTFGGPFMSLMIVFVPQVLVFSVLCTYIYRRTGNVFVGGFTVAMLACWIVTGGSALF